MTPPISVTANDLARARQVYEQNEARDLFYRVATELVDLKLRSKSQISLAEALAVLLQTWNKDYYRFRRFDVAHFEKLERLIEEKLETAMAFRLRSISSLSESDRDEVMRLYSEFEKVLHPVGAVKTLHLLAPSFFPLWDRKIASAYGCGLGPPGTNAADYFRFMGEVKEQVSELQGLVSPSTNLLKAIDEYNYCKFSKGWL